MLFLAGSNLEVDKTEKEEGSEADSDDELPSVGQRFLAQFSPINYGEWGEMAWYKKAYEVFKVHGARWLGIKKPTRCSRYMGRDGLV